MFPEWSDRIDKESAKTVQSKGEFIGDGASNSGCYWRGYRHDDRFYIGLCDGLDIWETDKQTMLDHCA